MILPKADHIGKTVFYRSYERVEPGKITSFNQTVVFVDYGSSAGRGLATSFIDLFWTKAEAAQHPAIA